MSNFVKKEVFYAANKRRKDLTAMWTWGAKYFEHFPREQLNPFIQVEKFKTEKQARYIPPQEDFWKVYEACDNQQDRTMLLTFLYLAARRGEVFRLKWEDIDFSNDTIRLNTRKRLGGLEHDILPMAKALKSSLFAHWESRKFADEHVFICESSPIPSNIGKPFLKR